MGAFLRLLKRLFLEAWHQDKTETVDDWESRQW
jgi:hypothetical protein